MSPVVTAKESWSEWTIDAEPTNAPPPPPGVRAAVGAYPERRREAEAAGVAGVHGHPFDAQIEVGELDEKSRPGVAWVAKGREVSRERLVFLSRRMVRAGSLVIIAVHLLDDAPMPLFGKVVECEYQSEGMHRVVVEFRAVPWDSDLRVWMAERDRK